MVSTIQAPLFVPASRPDRFVKAATTATDAVILDLEDAVPADEKEAARAALTCDFTQKPVLVRVNGVATPWHQADVAALRGLPIAAVMLPKSETPAEIATLWHALDFRVPVIALIETAKGLANARSIAAHEGVVRLTFGSIDYCADLGCAHQRDVLLPVRSELVLASRLAGIAAPIDGVTAKIDNLALLEEDTLHARSLGMTGKLCIHPTQVAVVKQAFSPLESEIAWARKILESGDGAVSVDGEMVDEPVRLRARSILIAASKGTS